MPYGSAAPCCSALPYGSVDAEEPYGSYRSDEAPYGSYRSD